MPPPLSLPPVDGQTVHFLEAIRAAEARNVVLPDIYYGQLQGVARQLAFSIAGVASYDQLKAVKNSLDKWQANGKTFAQWQREVAVKDLELPKYRLENIFRTNLQGNYQAGHWEQIIRNQQHRPYLMYDAINDSRTRPAHRAMDNIIRPIDDVFWKTHSPPNGYMCRCGVISLTQAQAQARSKDGTGLNKIIDETTMQPDKGWGYSPRDRLQGVEQALAKRREQNGDVLLSALDNLLNHNMDMKIINLPEFSSLQKTMSDIAGQNSDWFPSGFNGIHAVDRDDMFAATSDGFIYFSVQDKLVAGFKPALDLASAFTKAKDGGQLTFNEEYALESLWHEIKHAVYKHNEMPSSQKLKYATEGMLQFTARHSYNIFLSALKLTQNHQPDIIRRGYSYEVEVANYRNLLQILNIDEKEAVLIADQVFTENKNIDDLIEQMATALAKLTDYPDDKISYALKSLSKHSGFREKVIKKLGY